MRGGAAAGGGDRGIGCRWSCPGGRLRSAFVAASPANFDYRGAVSDEPGVVVRKRVRTGPLPVRPREDLEPGPGVEGRLPLLFLIGFLVLVVIQLALAL